MKVLVLYGGNSTEHEVSVHSAQTVCRILSARPDKYTVYPVFISKQGYWFLQEKCGPQTGTDVAVTPVLCPQATLQSLDGDFSVKIDVVFPVLHGSNGEDGTIQGFLETLKLPYVGCGILASAMGMDKELTKRLVQKAGVPIVPYQKISAFTPYDKNALEKWGQEQGYPLFVKPVRLGSSVGVRKVHRVEELHAAISYALQFDTDVLVEKGIDRAREVFCGVFGENDTLKVSACGELSQTSGEFFDYTAKYVVVGGCNMHIPAQLPAQTAENMRRDTALIFRALQGSGLARTDFLVGADGSYYFSEINTLPGMSETSLWPQLFEACGESYPQLLDALIELALRVYKRKHALVSSRV